MPSAVAARWPEQKSSKSVRAQDQREIRRASKRQLQAQGEAHGVRWAALLVLPKKSGRPLLLGGPRRADHAPRTRAEAIELIGEANALAPDGKRLALRSGHQLRNPQAAGVGFCAWHWGTGWDRRKGSLTPGGSPAKRGGTTAGSCSPATSRSTPRSARQNRRRWLISLYIGSESASTDSCIRQVSAHRRWVAPAAAGTRSSAAPQGCPMRFEVVPDISFLPTTVRKVWLASTCTWWSMSEPGQGVAWDVGGLESSEIARMSWCSGLPERALSRPRA